MNNEAHPKTSLEHWVKEIDEKVDEILQDIREVKTNSNHAEKRYDDLKSEVNELRGENREHRDFRAEVRGEFRMVKYLTTAIGVLAAIAVAVIMIVK